MDSVEKGIIEIRFSAFTLAEIIHANETYKDSAVQRARVLNELCRRKCLRPISSVMVNDAIHFCLRARSDEAFIEPIGYAYSDSNDWLDSHSWKNFSEELKTKIRSNIEEQINSLGLSRTQRRLIRKRSFPNGRLSKEAVQSIIDDNAPIKLSGDNGSINLEDFIEKKELIQWMQGNISSEIFQESLLSNLRNVELIFEKVASYNNQEVRDAFRGFINEFGVQLVDKLGSVIVQISEQRETLPDCDDNRANSLISKALKQGVISSREHVLRKMFFDNINLINAYDINEDFWNKHVVKSEIGNILSVDIIMLLMKHIVSKRLKDKSYTNTMSDGGDVLHASYAKYCDIMRIDKRTHNLIQEIQRDVPEICTKFVKNIEDLPEMISKSTALNY